MNPLYTIRDALSAFFSSPLRKWSSVFLLAVLALGGAYYYQIQSLGKVQAAYTIANSARFISGNSDYLSRTPAGAGNQKTWTFSGWVKRAGLGTSQTIFSAGTGSGRSLVYFDSTDNLIVQTDTGLDNTATAILYRDPAVWMHVVAAIDTTQATAANRIKLYVNGQQITFTTTNYPSLNFDTD